MYIDIVPNRGSRPAVLLREVHRDGNKVIKRTVANLTSWPQEQVEALRLILKGEKMLPADQALGIEMSTPHGHVEAILGTIRRIGLDQMISSTPSRERDLVLGMIAQRLIGSGSKLSATQLWNQTTLADELNVSDANVNELYTALDWLHKRQRRIENKLAKAHLQENALALYDVSSSYYEGRKCQLARFGYNRDRKREAPAVSFME